MSRRRSVSIRVDERARVPFAMIGVLLLVSSVGIVATLETRPEPTVDDDSTVALDRTVAASQTAVRAAAVDATENAARSPVTEPDPNSTVGAAIADREDDPLDAYLALLIYLETEQRLEHIGQDFGGETSITASLPPVEPTTDSVEAALDRVEIATPNEADVENGTLRVTVEDVAFEAERGGTTVADRQEDLTVTVASTLHELHEHTEEYESRLNTGIFDEGTGYNGLGRRLAARLYPVSYLKIAHKYRNPNDFENVTSNDHTEVLANHAAFSVQESTFGTTDPHGERTMRGAWACMGTDIGEELLDTDTDSDESYDAEQLCEDLEYVYGDHEGELPDAPTLTELAEDEIVDSEFAEETVEIPIDELADLAYFDVVGEEFDWDEDDPMTDEAFEDIEDVDSEDTPESLDTLIDTASGEVPGVVDSVYSASVRAEDDIETSGDLPSAEPPDRVAEDSGNWTEVHDDRKTIVNSSNTTVDSRTHWRDETAQSRPLYSYEITLTNEYEQTRTWEREIEATNGTDGTTTHGTDGNATTNRTESVTSTDRSTKRFEVVVEIDGRHSHGTAVDATGHDPEIEYAFRPGGSTRPTPDRQRVGNFEAVRESAVEKVFHTDADPETVPDRLEQRVQPDQVFDSEQLVSMLDYEDDSWLDVTVEPDDGDAFEAWLEAETDDVRAAVKAEVGPLEVERHELITADNSPIKGYVGELRQAQDDIVFDGEPDGYENAPAKARAELRLAYIESLIDAIEAVGDSHEDLRDGIEDNIGDQLGEDATAVNNVLDTSLGIGQDALNGDIEENAGSIDSSPLTEEMGFEVRGAPTYLSIEPVERDEVAAVRPADAPPLDTAGTTHAPMTARYGNWIGYPGFPVIPFPSFWYASFSVWDVEVSGEYARFEVSAADGAPDSPAGTTYIREDRSVHLELDGKRTYVGSVEPIRFDSRTVIVGVVPGGSPGVGDTDTLFDCTDTWDNTGPDINSRENGGTCPGNTGPDQAENEK